jgi:hypothetical protein
MSIHETFTELASARNGIEVSVVKILKRVSGNSNSPEINKDEQGFSRKTWSLCHYASQ